MPSSSNRGKIVAMAVVFEGGLGLLAIAAGTFFGASPWHMIEWNLSAALWGVAGTLPLLFVLWVSIYARFKPLAELRELVDRLIAEVFAGCSLLQLALVAALAGFGEELFFRGLVQHFAMQWFGTPAGLIAASVLFGLAHPMSKSYVLLAALIGLYLGGLWLAADNLLPSIVVHGLYDFVALVYFVRWKSKRRDDERESRERQPE